VKTITTSSSNLFRIAAMELGDAMQWIAIARYNRIRDPMISELTTVVIPSASPQFSDGLGPQ
jgi:hypothetical protein